MTRVASDARIGLIGFGRMGARLAGTAEDAGMSVETILDSCDTPYGLSIHSHLAAKMTRDPDVFWSTGGL